MGVWDAKGAERAGNFRIKQALQWLESVTEESPSNSRPNSRSNSAPTSPILRRLPSAALAPGSPRSPRLPSVTLVVRNSTRLRLRMTSQWYEHGEGAPWANPSSLASLAPGKVGTFHVHSTTSSSSRVSCRSSFSAAGALAGVEGALVLCNEADYTERLIVLFSNLTEHFPNQNSTAEKDGRGAAAEPHDDQDDPSSSGCSFFATYSVDKCGSFCNRMYRELRSRARQAHMGGTVVEAEPGQRYAVASRMTRGTRAVLAVEIVDVSGSQGRWRSPFGGRGNAWALASMAHTPVAA